MNHAQKRLFKIALRFLPAWIRHELVRRSIQLPDELPSSLIFKIAETTEELEKSFRLVYESYLPLEYCTENKFKMRATIYHALPTTTTLIALDQGQVVGTLTIVRDNRLGLPLDKIFDVKALRKQVSRVAEITALVIHKDYRREKGGQILFPLLRLMYEYSTSYFGVNHLLVTIHPDTVHFYKSLLLFKTVPNTGVQNYLGAPAVCLQLDLQRALFDYENAYAKRKKETNLFHFFVQRKLVNIQLPKRTFNKINDPLVRLDYFQKVFVEQLQVPIDFTGRRRVEACLRQNGLDRRDPRIEVEAPAHSAIGPMTIKDVSRFGFRALVHESFSIQSEFNVQIEVGPGVRAQVTAQVVWISPEQGVGFEILGADQNWNDFINFLYKEQYGSTG